MIERAFAGRRAGDVPPPPRLTVDHGDVRGDMPAVERRHPKVAGCVMRVVVGLRREHATADAHALEIDDRFGKDGKMRRRRAVRPRIEPLAERDCQLVVDKAVRRIPLPGVAIFGRDQRRRRHMREILQAPWIGLANRHRSARYLSSVIRSA